MWPAQAGLGSPPPPPDWTVSVHQSEMPRASFSLRRRQTTRRRRNLPRFQRRCLHGLGGRVGLGCQGFLISLARKQTLFFFFFFFPPGGKRITSSSVPNTENGGQIVRWQSSVSISVPPPLSISDVLVLPGEERQPRQGAGRQRGRESRHRKQTGQ
ncbi:hypothetical protein LY76DRAFT_595911 [Colletotrichum caudatum]|nr:hypothetical protein LY76DRAFT_595911 [Colletotrichum caudatum]